MRSEISDTPARIAVIGAGHVGATTAYALMLRALVSEIVLIDANRELAEAEAADISDANALARPARIWAGDYNDAASARIAIITAGAATQGHESRLSVLADSAAIVEKCTKSLADAGFSGIILVAANPVDLMAHVAFQYAGLDVQRVIGTGTLLDSNRLRQVLATKFEVAPNVVTGLILGEHGDSAVAAFSNVRIGGLTMAEFAAPNPAPDAKAVAREVRDAAYQIVAGKGYTSFGVATAIVRICEAILRNEQTVLPVSTLLTGQFGIHDAYLSLPCVLGAQGVERVLVPDLTADEQAALLQSAAIIRKAMMDLAVS